MPVSLEKGVGVGMGEIQTDIRWDPSVCVGCARCQVICAYHTLYQGGGSREGYVKVTRDYTGSSIRWRKEKCDLCPGEAVPLCVEVCPAGALQLIRKS